MDQVKVAPLLVYGTTFRFGCGGKTISRDTSGLLLVLLAQHTIGLNGK